ncbi:MAG TPA: hypothetical protein VF600_08595 [Abditibacteriaceae bacterium]
MGSSAIACLNDRDSDLLERESGALPRAMQVITGRFERNPPLFYEMRLKRVAAQLKQDPSQLSLYDDAAVASDRIGRSNDAIMWIEKKHTQLLQQKPFTHLNAKIPANESLREHWYRYHANVGTFWAHRWIRNGADRSKISEIKTAADHIATAIKIKPNAHFGREKYQLKTMRWIISPPKATAEDPLPNILKIPLKYGREELYEYQYNKQGAQEELRKKGLTDAVEGLTGLIVLGNAWESLDVFYALQLPLEIQGKGSLSEMAQLRSMELIAAGKRSLYPQAPTSTQLQEVVAPHEDQPIRSYSPQKIQEIYTRLRDEAEEYQQKRTAYMMTRLQKGRHPDTDATFWKGWHDAGPPPPVPFTMWEKHGSAFTIIAGGLLFSLASLFQIRRRHALART